MDVRDPPIMAAVVNAETVTGSAKNFIINNGLFINKQSIITIHKYQITTLRIAYTCKNFNSVQHKGIGVNNDRKSVIIYHLKWGK